jgi:hypothetical protein
MCEGQVSGGWQSATPNCARHFGKCFAIDIGQWCVLNWMISVKNQCIRPNSKRADIDDDNLSCGGGLAGKGIGLRKCSNFWSCRTLSNTATHIATNR